MSQQPPNWYPDPDGGGGLRYWDGTQWTENRAPGAAVAPMPPAKKKRGCLPILGIAAAVIIVLIVIAAVAGSKSSSSKPSSSPGTTGVSKGITAGGSTDPTHEVKITKCIKDPILGDLDIKGTATNDTSKRSDFIIEFAITDSTGKTQLGTTTALANNVEPGQTALFDAPSTVTFQAGAICKVSTVNRTASVG